MQQSTRSFAEIHIAVLLFGLAGLFGKFILLPSIAIVFGRVFFASVALVCLLFLKKQNIRLRSWQDYAGLAFLGVVLAVHWWSFFESIQISTVAIGLITFSTFPVFAAFLEPFFTKEKLHMKDVILAGITFAGVIVAIPSFEFGSNTVTGALLGTLSGATFALLSVLNRRYVQRYDSLTIALYQDAIAALVLLPLALTYAGTATVRDILLLVLLGVVFTASAHALFIKGMMHIKAKTASVIASLESVYGILFAAVLLAEIPSLRTVLGGIVVLLACLYASVSHKKDN